MIVLVYVIAVYVVASVPCALWAAKEWRDGGNEAGFTPMAFYLMSPVFLPMIAIVAIVFTLKDRDWETT